MDSSCHAGEEPLRSDQRILQTSVVVFPRTVYDETPPPMDPYGQCRAREVYLCNVGLHFAAPWSHSWSGHPRHNKRAGTARDRTSLVRRLGPGCVRVPLLVPACFSGNECHQFEIDTKENKAATHGHVLGHVDGKSTKKHTCRMVRMKDVSLHPRRHSNNWRVLNGPLAARHQAWVASHRPEISRGRRTGRFLLLCTYTYIQLDQHGRTHISRILVDDAPGCSTSTCFDRCRGRDAGRCAQHLHVLPGR